MQASPTPSVWLAFALVATAPAVASAASSDIASGCRTDHDCAAFQSNPWCHDDGYCWTCEHSTQCADDDEICMNGACIVPCADALDCTSQEPICDAGTGQCAQCLDNDGCTPAEHCTNGTCRPDVCEPGRTACNDQGDGILSCRDDGSGFASGPACSGDTVCSETGNAAACVGDDSGTDSTGGASHADTAGCGGSPGDGPPSTSSATDAGDGTSSDDSDASNNDAAGCRIDPRETARWPLWLLAGLLLVRRRPVAPITLTD